MNLRVLGYGDNVIDHYINQRIMYPGGNALNVAVNAFKNNVFAAYLGEFGNDEEGKYIRSVLNEIGLDISHSITPSNAVTEIADVKIEDGDRIFVGAKRGTRRAIKLTDEVLQYISQFSLIHSGCHAATEKELPKLKNVPILRSFDFSDPEKYRTNGYLERVAPHIDFAVFSCSNDSENEMNRLYEICNKHGVKYILMTRGSNPPFFYCESLRYEGEVKFLDDVKDTMGAGDAYCSAFMVSLLKSGWSVSNKPNQEQISQAFKDAAEYSAKTCLIDGSFGYGKKY